MSDHYGTGTGGGGAGGGMNMGRAPAPTGVSTAAKLAIGCGAVVVVGGLAGVIALAVWGLSLYSDEVCDYLKESEKIVAELGPVSSCEARWSSSGQIEEGETFVFALQGPRGSGRAFVKSETGDDGAEVYSGILLVVGTREILIEGVRPPTK